MSFSRFDLRTMLMPRRGIVRMKPSCSRTETTSRTGVPLTPKCGGELRLIQTQLLLRIIDVGIRNRGSWAGLGLVAQLVAFKGPGARAQGLTPGNLVIYGISEGEFKAGSNHCSCSFEGVSMNRSDSLTRSKPARRSIKSI